MTNAYVIVHNILTYRNRQKHNGTCNPEDEKTIKQYDRGDTGTEVILLIMLYDCI